MPKASPPKRLIFDANCSLSTDQLRHPFRVDIKPEDTTHDIIESVRKFFGFEKGEISFEDDDRNIITPHYNNFRKDIVLFVMTKAKVAESKLPSDLPVFQNPVKKPGYGPAGKPEDDAALTTTATAEQVEDDLTDDDIPLATLAIKRKHEHRGKRDSTKTHTEVIELNWTRALAECVPADIAPRKLQGNGAAARLRTDQPERELLDPSEWSKSLLERLAELSKVTVNNLDRARSSLRASVHERQGESHHPNRYIVEVLPADVTAAIRAAKEKKKTEEGEEYSKRIAKAAEDKPARGEKLNDEEVAARLVALSYN